MALEQILIRYPELADKLRDTINDSVKLIFTQKGGDLFLITDSDTPFRFIGNKGTFSCETLEDMDEYIRKQYPLRKGDIITDMPWIAKTAEVIAVNNKAFIFKNEKGGYGIAYNALYKAKGALWENIQLDLALKIAKNEFGLLDNEHIYTKSNIYELKESGERYLLLRDLSSEKYLMVFRDDISYDNNEVAWENAKSFDTFPQAQTYAWQQCDSEQLNKFMMLKQKIKNEYAEFMSNMREQSADELLHNIRRIYAMEMINQAFDNESGVFIPKKTMEYLLDENVSAISVLTERISSEYTSEYCIESVNAAADELQIEFENQIVENELELG